MTLLETVYIHLKHNELTHSAEHFSKEYLNKSRSWYAVQTHMQRDFSLSAAIECLIKVHNLKNTNTKFCKEQKEKLRNIEELIIEYLIHHHGMPRSLFLKNHSAPYNDVQQ